MKIISFIRNVSLGIIIFSILPTTAYALDWLPQLVQIKNAEYRLPRETLQIKIPKNVPKKVLKTLAYELDNIDITAMIIRKGTTSSFTPAQPLTWGKHNLRLVEYGNDGSIIEKGFWEFKVRKSAVFQKVEYAVNSSLTVLQRIADKNLGSPKPNALTGYGAAKVLGRASNEDWDISGNLDLIYNSEESQTPHGKELDIGKYLFIGRGSSSQVNIGHHSITQNNLIVGNFYRRGVSASMRFGSINSTATGFVMRSEEIVGTKDGFGVSDPDNKVTGISWESQPLTKNPEKLYLSATYLSGKSNKISESVGAIQADKKGTAWALSADSALYDQQLRLRAEYAGSLSDIITADISDTNIVDEKGSARSFLATYSPRVESENSKFFWNTGIEYTKVSTSFNSIANLSLPNDKDLRRLFINADWTGFSTSLLKAIETDNVDGDDTRPQIETHLDQVVLNYSLTDKPSQSSIFNTIGMPTFSLQWNQTTQDRIKDALVPTEDISINANTSALSANFIKDSLGWGWMYSRTVQKDKFNAENNSVTLAHNLNANFTISNNLGVRSGIQTSKTNFSTDGSTSDTVLFNLGLNYLFSKSLSGLLNINNSNTDGSSINGLVNANTKTTSFQLKWNWLAAKNNKPGFDVTLSGTRQETSSNLIVGNNIDAYQAFIGITMTLPSKSIR